MPVSCWWQKAKVMFTASRGVRSCHGGCQRGSWGAGLLQLLICSHRMQMASNLKPHGVGFRKWSPETIVPHSIKLLLGLKWPPELTLIFPVCRNIVSGLGRFLSKTYAYYCDCWRTKSPSCKDRYWLPCGLGSLKAECCSSYVSALQPETWDHPVSVLCFHCNLGQLFKLLQPNFIIYKI